MSKVTLYVKDGCPYCAAARKHFTEEGYEITEVNVPKTPGAREKMLELSGGKSIVPVIEAEDGTVTVGFGGG